LRRRKGRERDGAAEVFLPVVVAWSRAEVLGEEAARKPYQEEKLDRDISFQGCAMKDAGCRTCDV
jgi:hypothetical protein